MMKNKILFSIWLLLMVCFTSCHHDEPTLGVDFSQLDNAGKRFVPYSEEERDVREEEPWNRLPEDAASDVQDMAVPGRRPASSITITDMARGLLESLNSYKVHQVCGTYMTTGADGEPVKVSGAVFYPKQGRIKNVIICSHYTVTADYEVPSQTFPIEALLASLGYVVVMPDYIGYGASKDRVHPYLQAYVTAGTVIDMALAVRPFLANRKIVVDNEEVILFGYSQGGATGLFVQLMMEQSAAYKGLFKIKCNYCGGGPYNIARTYDETVRTRTTGIPYAVPMLILGMSEGMAVPLDVDAFFREPLLSHYKEWLLSKRYAGSQITRLMGTRNIDKILTPMALDRSQPETKRLYRALAYNSIPANFVPEAPVYMFHSMDDQTVPFINAQVQHGYFTQHGVNNVTYDFGHYGEHADAFLTFMKEVFRKLK